MNNSDITIIKVNEALVKIVTTNPIIDRELKRAFSAKVQNYKFMPAYRQRAWSGDICAINKGMLSIGLVPYLREFAKNGGYTINANFDDIKDIRKSDVEEFIIGLQIPFSPYDYQVEASYKAIKNTKLNINLPTGSGKSLVQYIIASFMYYNDAKTLIIVPTISLVNQLFQDFIDYGMIDPYMTCHTITAGKTKTLIKPITISTYQSLQQLPSSFYKSVDCLLIDECHGAKSTTIQKIAKSCANAHYRIGLSGTYPEPKSVDWFSIVGAVGEIERFASYQKLRNDKRVAGIKIKDLILCHPEEIRSNIYHKASKNFQTEIEHINQLDYRNNFISKLTHKLKGNTIVLFTRLEHGKLLEEDLRHLTDKNIYYVDGSVSGEDREVIRKTLEKETNAVLFASFGVFSVGTNIKNIHNIIFASNYKSKVKVIQAIGRGIRVSDTKDEVAIYDIIDNLQYKPENGKKYINYSLRHYKERIRFYEEEGYTDREVKKIKV